MNPVLKKLGFKGQDPVLIVDAPPEYAPILSEVPSVVHNDPQGRYEFVQYFIMNLDSVKMEARRIAGSLEGDGHLWLCYPKTSSRNYRTDLTRDNLWSVLGPFGYEPVTQVSIDDDWSAIRYRHVDRIRKMTRKFAATEKGKERLGL